MSYLDEISARINQVIAHFTNGNVSKFGRMLNMKPDTISFYIGKKEKISMPPAEFISKLVGILGISSDWILIGSGEMFEHKKITEVSVKEIPPEWFMERFEFWHSESLRKDIIINEQASKIAKLEREKKEYIGYGNAAEPTAELKKKQPDEDH